MTKTTEVALAAVCQDETRRRRRGFRGDETAATRRACLSREGR